MIFYYNPDFDSSKKREISSYIQIIVQKKKKNIYKCFLTIVIEKHWYITLSLFDIDYLKTFFVDRKIPIGLRPRIHVLT